VFSAYELATSGSRREESEDRSGVSENTVRDIGDQKDTRIAQSLGNESGVRWDPISQLFEVIVGGAIVGAKATWDAASDLYHHVMKSEKKDDLPKDKNGNPVPDSEHPHTQLRTRKGSKGPYRKTREWGKDGKLEKDIDWTDHGRPKDHPNLHQHRWQPNPTGGTPQRGSAEPLK
jgi:hypothetical protein